MGSLSIWHWLIVLLVVLLLFGSKKLPDAARGLGRSMRIFKSEIKEMQNDDAPAEPQQLPASGAQPAAGYTAPQAHPEQQAAVQPGAQQGFPQAPQQPYAQPGQVQPGSSQVQPGAQPLGPGETGRPQQ